MNHCGGRDVGGGGVTDADSLMSLVLPGDRFETSSIFSLIKKHAHPHSSTERRAQGKSPPNWLHSTDRSQMSSIDSLHLKRNVISKCCHTRRTAGHPARLVLHKLQTTFQTLNTYKRFASCSELDRCANIPKKKTCTDV